TWYHSAIRPVVLHWGAVHNGVAHRCRYCAIDLLMGEDAGFCCGPHGSRLHDVQPLPPLPAEYDLFMQNSRISELSRRFNLIFSFAALESSHRFPNIARPLGFIAMEGRVYHR
ncbi:hypothetical protein BDY19DRAFT_870302, partial [Irpex rosettiformis]